MDQKKLFPDQKKLFKRIKKNFSRGRSGWIQQKNVQMDQIKNLPIHKGCAKMETKNTFCSSVESVAERWGDWPQRVDKR